MNDETTDHESTRRRRRHRRVRTGVLAGALVGVALLAAACSSGSSNANSPSVGATSSSSSTNQQKALAYTSCMRSHGITNFPDPNSQGSFVGRMGRLNASSPQYIKANQTCEKLLPDGGQITPGQSQKLEAEGLQYAECMRSNGITSFPDPTVMSNGAVSLAAPGVDSSSPEYQSANQACKSDLHATGSDG
jgi:hypothetical protein